MGCTLRRSDRHSSIAESDLKGEMVDVEIDARGMTLFARLPGSPVLAADPLHICGFKVFWLPNFPLPGDRSI